MAGAKSEWKTVINPDSGDFGWHLHGVPRPWALLGRRHGLIPRECLEQLRKLGISWDRHCIIK